MKKLRIERKTKSSSDTASASSASSSSLSTPLEDCFVLEDVPILKRSNAEPSAETPFGNNVVGFIGKAGVGKTTLAETVTGNRSMSSPAGRNSCDDEDFGVALYNENGMVVLDSSSILSGIFPPLKTPPASLSLSSLYVRFFSCG